MIRERFLDNFGRTKIFMIGHPKGGKKKVSFGSLLDVKEQPFPSKPVRQYLIPSRQGNSD